MLLIRNSIRETCEPRLFSKTVKPQIHCISTQNTPHRFGLDTCLNLALCSSYALLSMIAWTPDHGLIWKSFMHENQSNKKYCKVRFQVLMEIFFCKSLKMFTLSLISVLPRLFSFQNISQIVTWMLYNSFETLFVDFFFQFNGKIR